MEISLCMIIKDEQEVLDRCLSSFKDLVDEIIIVDTGSNDDSLKIASKYTNKIYQYKWNNDFASARNYSISKATKEYFMWVDADDYIKQSEKQKLQKLKETEDGSVDMYYFLYDFDKNYVPFYRERLIKNNNKYLFKGKIHEAIIPSNNRKYVDIKITQFDKQKGLTNRNLDIFESMKESEFTSRDYYYYGKELYRHNKLVKAKEVLEKYINLKDGYVEDKIDACYLLSLIYKKDNDIFKSLTTLYQSFIYDLPRANILCEIGSTYFSLNEIDKAIYYYKLALKCKKDSKSIILKDYYGYIPCIQLCVCYFKLNDINNSIKYNNLANTYKKDGKEYLYNKSYFEKLLKNK